MGDATSGLLTEIDHVAIAVRDLEAAIAYYSEAFGAEVHHREVVESDGVEEALIKVADSYIQLTAATTPDSPDRQVDREARRGPPPRRLPRRRLRRRAGRHGRRRRHADRPGPAPGSRGTTVAFVHPKGSFGTLIELVQEPVDAGSGRRVAATPSASAARRKRSRTLRHPDQAVWTDTQRGEPGGDDGVELRGVVAFDDEDEALVPERPDRRAALGPVRR